MRRAYGRAHLLHDASASADRPPAWRPGRKWASRQPTGLAASAAQAFGPAALALHTHNLVSQLAPLATSPPAETRKRKRTKPANALAVLSSSLAGPLHSLAGKREFLCQGAHADHHQAPAGLWLSAFIIHQQPDRPARSSWPAGRLAGVVLVLAFARLLFVKLAVLHNSC